MVGDGINGRTGFGGRLIWALPLAAGTDVAIESAQVVLVNGDIRNISTTCV